MKEEGRKLLRCSTGFDFVFSGNVHMFRKRKLVRLGQVEIAGRFVYLLFSVARANFFSYLVSLFF